MRFIRPLAAALALAVSATAFVGSADAKYWGPYHRHYYPYHHHNHGAAVAAGVFGFAAGAIVGGALAQPYYYRPAPVYVAPRPIYRPAPVYASTAPWTPGWYQSCSARYRSFNPQTGYFLGYDGNYHFCR